MTDAALALALERNAPWVAGELAYWRWQAGIREELPAGDACRAVQAVDHGRLGARGRALETDRLPVRSRPGARRRGRGGSLRQALDELQALGARPAAAIVARRLRARGVRGVPRGPRPSTRQNPAGLTARELEVLALVAEGLRNAEIAERLVVSPKTIDHHVSAILRKLDVPTRGHAAAAAARLGLLDPPGSALGD